MACFVPPAIHFHPDLTKVAHSTHTPDQEGPVQLEFGFMKELHPCSWHVLASGRFHRVFECPVLGCKS